MKKKLCYHPFKTSYFNLIKTRYNFLLCENDFDVDFLRFRLTGQGLSGYIHYDAYNDREWRIFVDRKGLFDKYSKCPIQLIFPKNNKQLDYLLDKLAWLETKEGYLVSLHQQEQHYIIRYP